VSAFQHRWRLTGALILCCLVLAALLAVEWREGARQTVTVGQQTPDRSVRSPPIAVSYDVPARSAFDEILKRPVFSPDRRPPDIPQPTASAPAPQVPIQVRLEGVAMVGQVRIAVLRDLSNNEGIHLSEGMEYQGWTVDAVEVTRAVLKRDGQTQELKLERK